MELQESLKLMQSKQSLLNATQKRTHKQEISLPKLSSPHEYKEYKGDIFSNFGVKSGNKRYGGGEFFKDGSTS